MNFFGEKIRCWIWENENILKERLFFYKEIKNNGWGNIGLIG